MGISIKGNGGGARVTIDGKPVTEKMELESQISVNTSTETLLDVYSISSATIKLNDKVPILIEPTGRYSGIFLYDVDTFQKKSDILDNLDQSADALEKDGFVYYLGEQTYLTKINPDTKEKTVLCTLDYFKKIFTFKDEIYVSKSDIYKYNTKNNSMTKISNMDNADVIYRLYHTTEDAIYCFPRGVRYNRLGTGLKFDGRARKEFGVPCNFQNSVSSECFVFKNKVNLFSIPKTHTSETLDEYEFNEKKLSFTLIGSRAALPYGIQYIKKKKKYYGFGAYNNTTWEAKKLLCEMDVTYKKQ